MKFCFHFHKAVFSFLINCITKVEPIYNVILKIQFDFALEVWFSICRRWYNYISLPRWSTKQKTRLELLSRHGQMLFEIRTI